MNCKIQYEQSRSLKNNSRPSENNFSTRKYLSCEHYRQFCTVAVKGWMSLQMGWIEKGVSIFICFKGQVEWRVFPEPENKRSNWDRNSKSLKFSGKH